MKMLLGFDTIKVVACFVIFSIFLVSSQYDKVEVAAPTVSALVIHKRIHNPSSRLLLSVLSIATDPSTSAKHVHPPSEYPLPQQPQHRRSFIQTAVRNTVLHITTITASGTSISATETVQDGNDDDIIQITLTDPSMKLGLQLSNRMDDYAKSFPNKGMTVYVERIISPSVMNTKIEEGMILLNYTNAKDVQEFLLKKESYPTTLSFQKPRNPRFNVPVQSAYQIVKISPTCSSNNDQVQFEEQERQSSRQSQRGDVLGIIYEAHVDSPTGRIYDASYQRGTGQQPYQMVLGSGDMIIGVDQGLYDMCINEVRGIYIPPRLAYGTRGNHNFLIPPDSSLYWKVQLIRID